MKQNQFEREIEFLCKDLFEGGQNHTLIYGNKERTTELLKRVYERASQREELLCSWHEASKINNPLDFFKPILQLKYRKSYEELKEKDWFKNLVNGDDKRTIFKLAEFCGMEEKHPILNARKMPVFFIDGLEELFFKMDYGNLDEKDMQTVLTKSRSQAPLPNGFGNALRSCLHQRNKGIFYGTVHDTKSREFKATLGNYHYLFYSENFMNHGLWEEKT